MVEAVVWNRSNGKEVMSLLLDQLDAEVHITKEVLKELTWSYYSPDKEVKSPLLDRHGAEAQIAEEVEILRIRNLEVSSFT